MKSSHYLATIKDTHSIGIDRRGRGHGPRGTIGERVIAGMFPSRVLYGGDWASLKYEQVQHMTDWVYAVVHTICSKLSSIMPNMAYVGGEDKPGHTEKACRRSAGRYGQGQWVSDGGHSYLTMGALRSKALSVVKPHEILEPLEHDHLLRRLIENPNPVDTSFDLLYELQMFDELCGVDYMWAIPNSMGKPAELWCLPSHWVWPRTGGRRVSEPRLMPPDWNGAKYEGYQYIDPDRVASDQLIAYYEIRPWGGMGGAGILVLPPDEVIMTRWKSPINKIDGYSKLAAVAKWIDSEESVSKTRWAQMQNQARPELMIQLGAGYEDPDDDRIARLEAKIAQKISGEYNYGKPFVLPPGAVAQPLSFNPTEMAFYQCCSSDMEALTSDGWKKYNEIDSETLIACYSRDNDQLEYHKPTRILTSYYAGPMHQWKSDEADLLVTPGHRMFVQTYDKAGQPHSSTDPGSWRVERIRSLTSELRYRVKVSSPVAADEPPDVEIPMYKRYARGEPAMVGTYEIAPGDWARFVGWYVSEGHLTTQKKPKRHRMGISQRSDSVHVPGIETMLQKVPPYSWAKQINQASCYQWCATDRGIYLHVEKYCGVGAKNKKIPRYMMSWPAHLLRVLLDTAIAGDGKGPVKNKFGHTSWYYRTTSKQLADDISEIGTKCGLRTSIKHSLYNYKGQPNDYYEVHLSDHNYTNIHCEHQTTVSYDGYIWCVTVPTGLFVVRRNGKVHVTGNSEEQLRDMILAAWQMPKAALGISEGLTYGSVLATLASLCSNCFNPRLAMRGQAWTKHLGSRFDEKEKKSSWSSLSGRGYGGRSATRHVRLWWDDTVPADPQQVNADIAEDRAQNAITPDEVRTLRGREPYPEYGNVPWVQTPAGLIPFPIDKKIDLKELAERLKPILQPEPPPQPGGPGGPGGAGGLEGLLGGQGGEQGQGGGGGGPPDDGSGGQPPEEPQQPQGGDGGPLSVPIPFKSGAGVEEPNGQPSKSLKQEARKTRKKTTKRLSRLVTKANENEEDPEQSGTKLKPTSPAPASPLPDVQSKPAPSPLVLSSPVVGRPVDKLRPVGRTTQPRDEPLDFSRQTDYQEEEAHDEQGPQEAAGGSSGKVQEGDRGGAAREQRADTGGATGAGSAQPPAQRRGIAPQEFADLMSAIPKVDHTSALVPRYKALDKQSKNLLKLAENNRLYIHPSSIARITGGGEDVGQAEHHAYYNPKDDKFYKVSKEYGINRDWHEYMDRIKTLNDLYPELGYHVLGVTENPEGGVGIVTSMNRIAGEHPDIRDVISMFRDAGWESVGRNGWYDPKTGTRILDAHEGNFIKTRSGDLVPIDVHIILGNSGVASRPVPKPTPSTSVDETHARIKQLEELGAVGPHIAKKLAEQIGQHTAEELEELKNKLGGDSKTSRLLAQEALAAAEKG